ncbi:magnesium transporter [Clostridium sp. CM028]|uniref:magnesium transporter n=1 Tax=unclassified Clostridium TaxID=2614128 RepID=UPI001C0E2F05|nr:MULTISPECIES: magnesium transporter [unclassified Clostridium]MBU3091687.1 magnesium transporter [Clostridium sp. CF011]MBW9144813.1 magnesium transporter [Clostridium sp. CM027]MBW9149281.1 magnesium transporter [Clostridium sp. CM028]UVE40440.1 magnesium transporter [Clostridium sp. CM027]WAG69397.1 magnesium transporter [Clostridium sp. CF011]
MSHRLNQKELTEFLLTETIDEINKLIQFIHPADILVVIRQYDGDKINLFQKLSPNVIANIIDDAEDEEKYDLLSIHSTIIQKKIIHEMSSDELVDLLEAVSEDEAKSIMKKMNKEDVDEVNALLTYSPDSAGGIMATEFISVKENMTIGETLNYLQKEATEAETSYYIYVIGENDLLKGVISLKDIVLSNFDVKISDIMNSNAMSVPVDMDQEEVGHIFEKYGFLTMPVVDEDMHILGIITSDDIMGILSDEHTEDLYRLAGLKGDEKVTGSLKSSICSRLPWLFVNLITAILAASTVSFFEGTIQKVVALAVFMPIVAGMGGNVGTQTLTIIIRSIALGEIDAKNSKKILLKEFGVGLCTGVAVGIAVALLGCFWEKNIVFGIVIGLSMLLNMMAATIAGFAVPVILKKINIDPALASAVFVTTVTDILGFLFFLGLATLFLPYLI